jgi:hypothetical protein
MAKAQKMETAPFFFRKVDICIQVHAALKPRGLSLTSSQPWERHISYNGHSLINPGAKMSLDTT